LKSDVVVLGVVANDKLVDGGLHRLESVQNAVEYGKAMAAAVLGKDKPFVATPEFWSDQYDAELQMVVSSAGHD
jgi:3-phenylpropionate/trans-cinnamate dioxygenase ferredoxin reductase component